MLAANLDGQGLDRTLAGIAKLPKTSRQQSFAAPSDAKVSAIPSSNCFDPTLLAQSRLCHTRANRIGRQLLWREYVTSNTSSPRPCSSAKSFLTNFPLRPYKVP